MGAFYINNQKKINDLNEQISSKESELNEKDKELSKKDEKLNEAQKTEEDAKENDEKLKEQEKEATEIAKGAENLYFSANKYKQAGDYKTAIKYYEYSLKANDTYKFREDAIYNMALSYQKLGDDLVERPQPTANTNYGWPGCCPSPPRFRPAGCHQ